MKPIKVFSTEWLLSFGAFATAYVAGVISGELKSWWTPLIVIFGAIIVHDVLLGKLRLYARIDALKEARQIVKDVRSGR